MLLHSGIVHVFGQHEERITLFEYPNTFGMQHAFNITRKCNRVFEIVEAGDRGNDAGLTIAAQSLSIRTCVEKVGDGGEPFIVILPKFLDGGIHAD
jgi:hypothetical protein